MIKAILSEWPVKRPRRWTTRVNERLTAKEREAIQTSLARNRPNGDEAWQEDQAKRPGLLHTLRREGRPTKEQKAT